MICKIQNTYLTVSINTLGAELYSIQDQKGTEYLWQADAKYWKGRSPTLFPYIGRMIDKCYHYQGTIYPMPIHGFASSMEFSVKEQGDDFIVFHMEDTPETHKHYPWAFGFDVKYELKENTLSVAFAVENRAEWEMLFAVGGHPGFNTPGEFTDYKLTFAPNVQPKRIKFGATCFVEGYHSNYKLENGCIQLSHDLFDEDAIVLENAGTAVTLENPKTGYRLTVSYPQMKYIGFWQAVHTDAPYVCIEPWSSLPSPQGEFTNLETQEDLLRLAPYATYTNTWTIQIH